MKPEVLSNLKNISKKIRGAADADFQAIVAVSVAGAFVVEEEVQAVQADHAGILLIPEEAIQEEAEAPEISPQEVEIEGAEAVQAVEVVLGAEGVPTATDGLCTFSPFCTFSANSAL